MTMIKEKHLHFIDKSTVAVAMTILVVAALAISIGALLALYIPMSTLYTVGLAHESFGVSIDVVNGLSLFLVQSINSGAMLFIIGLLLVPVAILPSIIPVISYWCVFGSKWKTITENTPFPYPKKL